MPLPIPSGVTTNTGAILSYNFSNTQSNQITPVQARCTYNSPNLNISDPCHSSSVALFNTAGAVISGDVGQEALSGVLLGGTFASQAGTAVPYSPFITFGDAASDGAVRIGASKDPGDSSSETYFITQIKQETAPGVFQWNTTTANDDSFTDDPF